MAVLGVTSNYNWNSLKSDYTPFLLLPDTIQTIHASIRIRSGSIPDIIERVGKIFKEIMPDEPFEYSFLDETFNVQYKSEQVFGKLFVLFAGLAVAISCLGLLGLASFATTQRLKEIGIRKVMGASVINIVVLLCSQFIVIVLFASVISIPLAWIGMNHWLQGFAFRVDLAWDMFAVPILLLSAVTLGAVGPIVVNGALTNPAQVLKSE
jgi:putative ABC transport system permease protein